jgi:hypothetical protein
MSSRRTKKEKTEPGAGRYDKLVANLILELLLDLLLDPPQHHRLEQRPAQQGMSAREEALQIEGAMRSERARKEREGRERRDGERDRKQRERDRRGRKRDKKGRERGRGREGASDTWPD